MLDPEGPAFADTPMQHSAVDLDAFYALLERPAWMRRAACRGKVDLFFPERGPSVDVPAIVARARGVCHSCPVQDECAGAGADERHGMWAGLTAPERRQRRRRAA